jgi:autotransporter-associated beta strand protein
LTLSGEISDGLGVPAQLNLIGGNNGTTILSGANSYSGGTLVTKTTVQVRNNSAVGTGTVTLSQAQFQAGAANLNIGNSFAINDTPAGSAIDNNNRVLTLSGNLADGNGPGRLTFGNSGAGGRTILTGTNTYTGGTDICNCATVQLGDVTHKASIVGRIRNDGELRILNADTTGITRIVNDGLAGFFGITSAGTATIVNHALLGFVDHSTAGDATIRNLGGAVAFANHSSAGNAIIFNRAGGLIVFADNSSADNASITNRFGGQTIFGRAFGTDAPSAGNAVIVNRFAGNTEFNAFATASSATITNQFGGSTDFYDFSTAEKSTIITNNGGATFFHDNADGGTASFVTSGSGFVDFSYSVGIYNDGRINAGSIAGSGFYYIGAFNTLVVGGNNASTEVSGVIADDCGCSPGPGSLEKVGTGTMILSGTNTYTGTTGVFGGVLEVQGSIASSSLTTVKANAALIGAGTVGSTLIASGGIFLPGNGTPGSSMLVAGNLAFQSGALYLIQLNSTTSTFANVTGTAALDGRVGASFAAGSNVAPKYTILTAAGGRSGAFAGVDALGLPAGFVATLSYDPTHAYLNLVLDYAARSNLNVNQQNVNKALGNFFSANGGIPVAFTGLSLSGLTQVSGETSTGSQQATFDAMNLFLGLLTDPFVAGRDGFGPTSGGATPFAGTFDSVDAYAAKQPAAPREAFAKFATKANVARNDLFDPRWSVWGAAYGGGSTTDGNTVLGSNSATARAFGFAAGADYRILPATIAGFALAGGGTNFAVSGFGSGRSDLFQAGAFVRHNVGPAYITAAAAYAWQDVTTDRTVTVAGVDRLRAQFNANAWSGRVEGGYRYVTPWMGVTPYAAGQFTTYSLPAYAEQVVSGANTFALNYAAKDVTASRSELGVRTDKSFAMPNGIFTLRGRAAWAHNFNTDRSITPVFQTLPGAAFVVNGAAQARDAALTTASAEMKWLNGWSAAATFEGEFSHVTRSYAGKGVARYTW